jgi:hypothetical protein
MGSILTREPTPLLVFDISDGQSITQLGEAIHSEPATDSYGGGETIQLADARSGVNNNGYVLANTEGDDREVDDGDEEERLVQSEMDGLSQTYHRPHDLSAKAGIILVCPLSSSTTAAG